MMRSFAALSLAALMGLGIATATTEGANAAMVTTSTHFGPHGVTQTRTVRRGFRRMVPVCRKVVTVKRMPGRTVRSVRQVCR